MSERDCSNLKMHCHTYGFVGVTAPPCPNNCELCYHRVGMLSKLIREEAERMMNPFSFPRTESLNKVPKIEKPTIKFINYGMK